MTFNQLDYLAHIQLEVQNKTFSTIKLNNK